MCYPFPLNSFPFLGRFRIGDTGSAEDINDHVVALVTRRLIQGPFCFRPRNFCGPWLGPGGGIFNRELDISMLSAVRVKRSIRCSFSLDPRKLVRFVKFVVSTTNVSPSQCPTESPCHNRIFCGTCGRPSVEMTRVEWSIS